MQLWPSGPGSSWRLAVSLAFPPPPPPSVLDQHRRRQQQQPLFPGQHRLLPPAWRMWRPADSVPSMGRWLEGPSPRTSDHECEGRMKPALDSFTGDTTHLLREILQNKDKKLREQLNNNNTMKTYCSNGEVNGQEMMAAVMRSKSSGSECNSVHNDHNSVNSDERSGEESDMESAYDQAGSEELRDMEDSKRGTDTPNGTASAGESGKTPDSKEAKRARVENIITSMRHSPQPGQTDHGGSTAPQELKRPKRKQLQPQQHGEAGRGPTDSKLRKTERMQLVNSIRQLQNELMAVKQRFSELEAEEEEEAEDEDETEDDKHLKEAKENGEEPYADLVRDKDDVSGCGVRDLQNGWDMFTSRVEGGGSKLLKPDSDCGSLVRPGFPFSGKEHAFHHGPFKSAFGPLTQPNFQLLASTLKTELTQSINKIVDTALVKAMDAPSAKHSSHGSGHDHSSSSNAGSNNRSNSSGSNTSNSNGSMGLGSKANGLDTGRESMISLSERRPELAIPFDGMGDSFGFGRGVEKLSAFEPLTRGDPDLHRLPHPPVPFTSSYPFYLPTHLLQPPMYPTAEPEQTEALPLVVSTPKKPKRTKVTDTRLSPRAKNSLLQDNTPSSSHPDLDRVPVSYPHFMSHMLPTSVAIPNPSLNPDLLSASFRDHCFGDLRPSLTHSPHLDRSSPHSPENSSQYGGSSKLDLYDSLLSDAAENSKTPMTSTLTPMHLRKAKLMFFFVRYPSSAILKIYFPDINFNKNNTAQLVKWFSNFREFYYIQMEKYARQAIAEGCKNAEDLVVSNDSELFRVLNLHYNRNNQIEAPESFVTVVQSTLREFYKAISTAKDSEPSWKKAIYKIIARLDDAIPEYFKSPNWMEQLGEA